MRSTPTRTRSSARGKYSRRRRSPSSAPQWLRTQSCWSNHGKFILIHRRAIRLTSCFVHRLQSQSKGTDASLRYDGAIDALQRIAKEEGLSAFYRGFGTKATQTVFAAALMFAAKEEIAKAVHVSLFLFPPWGN